MEGQLRFRPMPCHQCPGCLNLDPSACKNVRECGAPQVLTIPTLSNPTPPTTRNGMMKWGVDLAQGCVAGDIIVLELSGLASEKFMVARVTGELAEAEGASTSWFGDVRTGDLVLRVQKLDPVVLGGTTFELRRQKDIFIFAEDVRTKLVLGEHEHIKQLPPPTTRATRSNPHYPRFTVSSAAHSDILEAISPVEADTVNRNDPHRLTGFKYFEEEEGGCQYIVEGFLEDRTEGGKKGRVFTIRNVDDGELDTMWEGSLLEKLREAKEVAQLDGYDGAEG